MLSSVSLPSIATEAWYDVKPSVRTWEFCVTELDFAELWDLGSSTDVEKRNGERQTPQSPCVAMALLANQAVPNTRGDT